MPCNTYKSDKEGYKICSSCGEEKPATLEYFKAAKGGLYGVQARCKECDKVYRSKTKEHTQNYMQSYYGTHKQDYVERYQNNKDERYEYQKRWIKDNPDKIKKYGKEYREKNSDKIKISYHNNRAQAMNIKGYFSLDDWNCCRLYFDDCCAYCGTHDENLTLDHVIPLSKNGKHHSSNIIPSCGHCNFIKQDTDFLIWFQKQPYYSKEKEDRIIDYIKENIDEVA